jgi:hypothetical protein
MSSAIPSLMTVYDGQKSLGQIRDHGRNRVLAWADIDGKRVALGHFADRKSAMAAVVFAHECSLTLSSGVTL